MAVSRFGTVGKDVGVFGRWSRLGWGILILTPLVIQFLAEFSTSLKFYERALLYLVAIGFVYSVAYWFLSGNILKKDNAWVNTVIFVGPALMVAWWNLLFVSLFELPAAFSFGMLVYIGLSFILQWKIKYGGCEVVALPILLFKKRYTTYCVPLVVVDAIEKVVVEKK